MSISGSIGAVLAGVILFPGVRKRGAEPIPEPEVLIDDDEIDAFIAAWHRKGLPQPEMARRLELGLSEIAERVARIPVPTPVSCETRVAEACKKLAGTSTADRKRTQEECLEWIRQFHRKTGALPSWTKVRTTLKLSNGTAHRYRNKIKAELELELDKAA